jgi:adenylate cyclase
MFEKAIEADSTYALAYAGIADCYSFQYQHTARSREVIIKADEASEKATKLAPALAEVYASRGIVMALRQQFDEAEKSFLYAIELDPTLFLGWFHYGRTCFSSGKLDKAARLFEQANRVEPDDYQSILLSAQVYDAIDCNDLAQTLRQRGVTIAEKWLELNPGDTRALYFAANAYVFLNEREKSLSLLQRALSLEPDDSMLLYNAGCVYALLGMKPEAFHCLEGAYKAGLTLRGWYENDSNLDSIRDDPRFVRLLEQMKDDSPSVKLFS